MKFRSALLAAIALVAASACARAGSTIDPTIPAQRADLTSAPLRSQFNAARTDINNLLGQFAGTNAPANPTVGQYWRKTNVTPNQVFKWTGTAWVQVETFDTVGGAATPFFGNRLLAWQQLIPGLGSNGQCLVFTGTSTNPTAQSCLNATDITATAPVVVSFAGVSATLSLNLDSNFAVASNNLALHSISAGNLLGNCGGSLAEPGPCSWNSFASQAIGTGTNSFPIYSGGAWGVKTLGTSVLDPGTGTLEALVPVQTSTTASYGFAASDFFKRTRRSNAGSAMTDTLPIAGTTGLANGTRIEIANFDATASDTVTAGAGTTIVGGASFVLGPGRDLMLTYDLANTAWRAEANSSTALLGPNNLSDVANVATARTNLGLGSIATQAASSVSISGGTISGVSLSGTLSGSPTLSGVPVLSGLSAGTCSSGIAIDASNNAIKVACPGAASSIQIGTTTVTSGTTANLLYNNGGTLANAAIASFLTAGSGITVTGTTNATIALSMNSAVLSGAPTNPTGTASTSLVQMGLGVTTCRFAPTYSTRVKFTIDIGFLSNTLTGDQTLSNMSFGTGAGPANSAAATGTTLSRNHQTLVSSANYQVPATITGIATGLTPGTTYWFDLQLAEAVGGTASATNITCLAEEVL